MRIESGKPVVNWDGLIKSKDLAGIKSIAFEMPFDGYISLNITGSDGEVARQLLTWRVLLQRPAHRELGWSCDLVVDATRSILSLPAITAGAPLRTLASVCVCAAGPTIAAKLPGIVKMGAEIGVEIMVSPSRWPRMPLRFTLVGRR